MRSMRQPIAGLLVGVVLAATAATARGESIDRYQEFIVVGQTCQREIRQALGSPREAIPDGDANIWVYSNKLKIPMALSLIPLIGDIADAIELVQGIQNNHELIIQFDAEGIVKKAKLRELD